MLSFPISDLSSDWDPFKSEVLLKRSYKKTVGILWKWQSTRHKYCKGWRSALDLSDVPNPGKRSACCTISLMAHHHLHHSIYVAKVLVTTLFSFELDADCMQHSITKHFALMLLMISQLMICYDSLLQGSVTSQHRCTSCKHDLAVVTACFTTDVSFFTIIHFSDATHFHELVCVRKASNHVEEKTFSHGCCTFPSQAFSLAVASLLFQVSYSCIAAGSRSCTPSLVLAERPCKRTAATSEVLA